MLLIRKYFIIWDRGKVITPGILMVFRRMKRPERFRLQQQPIDKRLGDRVIVGERGLSVVTGMLRTEEEVAQLPVMRNSKGTAAVFVGEMQDALSIIRHKADSSKNRLGLMPLDNDPDRVLCGQLLLRQRTPGPQTSVGRHRSRSAIGTDRRRSMARPNDTLLHE